MTAGDFEHQNAERWAEYERLVERVEKGKQDAEAEQLPRRFRELCLDLSLAESRMYGSRITERLNALVIRGYKVIYRARRGTWENVVAFVAVNFPQAVGCAVWCFGYRFSRSFSLPGMISAGFRQFWARMEWLRWNKCMVVRNSS
jgi:hypothetical protein